VPRPGPEQYKSHSPSEIPKVSSPFPVLKDSGRTKAKCNDLAGKTLEFQSVLSQNCGNLKLFQINTVSGFGLPEPMARVGQGFRVSS